MPNQETRSGERLASTGKIISRFDHEQRQQGAGSTGVSEHLSTAGRTCASFGCPLNGRFNISGPKAAWNVWFSCKFRACPSSNLPHRTSQLHCLLLHTWHTSPPQCACCPVRSDSGCCAVCEPGATPADVHPPTQLHTPTARIRRDSPAHRRRPRAQHLSVQRYSPFTCRATRRKPVHPA